MKHTGRSKRKPIAETCITDKKFFHAESNVLGEKSVDSDSVSFYERTLSNSAACRLCGKELIFEFPKTVLSKYRVSYFKCQGCGSLQTEEPYWLEEAYNSDAEQYDTGKASRTLSNFFLLPRLFEILGITPEDRCADFGGGTGLFARLMRDIGYNFYSYDKYGSSEFCRAFMWNSFDRPLRLVTIFECAEHFVNPLEEWESIFATKADFILGSTGIYAGQSEEWSYLSPESGQHIFFYTPVAFAHIAEKHGWVAYILGGWFLMARYPFSSKAGQEISEWNKSSETVCLNTIGRWMRDPFAAASADNARVTVRHRLTTAGCKIAIDGEIFNQNTENSRLWLTLLAEWSANGFGEYIVIIDREHTAPRFGGITYVAAPDYSIATVDSDRRMVQAVCDQHGIALFVSTSYTRAVSTPSVLMITDCILQSVISLDDSLWQITNDALKECRYFLSIAHEESRDFFQLCPEVSHAPIETVQCGTSFRKPSSVQIAEFKTRHGITRPYCMLSGVDLDLFFQAFELLGDRRNEFSVLCANLQASLQPEFEESIGDGVAYFLTLSDQDLQCAYAGAELLVFTSSYEGIPLPVLEAMACECPVITCNIRSGGKVGSDAVVYIDSDSPREMLEAIMAVREEPLRSSLIANGLQLISLFSPRKMGLSVEDILSKWILDI